MNFLSKLFSKNKLKNNTINENSLTFLKDFINLDVNFYQNRLIFCKNEKKIIKNILLHESGGVILFNFFNFSFNDLKNFSASVAEGDKNAQVKTQDEISLINYKFSEISNKEIAPVHSVLICPKLSEEEFDKLDKSFHELIPKNLTIFKDSTKQRFDEIVFFKKETSYDINLIKKALFFEFNISKKNCYMTQEQELAVQEPLTNNFLIKGIPASGKSSTLVAKALYEKIKNQDIKLIFFTQQSCTVHQLKSLIYEFIENSHLSLNTLDVEVVSFESIYKLSKDRKKYDLIVCDDINIADLDTLKIMLNKNGKLLVSSFYEIDGFSTCRLTKSFKLSDSLSRICLGEDIESFDDALSFQNGNVFMNTHIILGQLLKEANKTQISIIHHNKEWLLDLQSQINEYFKNISYMYDDIEKKDGILLYPLSKLRCVDNDYLIIIVDENSSYDDIELISRANKKSFILSQNKNVKQILTDLKDKNESNQNSSSAI